MYPKDPKFPPNGVEDMTRLAYLHEPGVLQNLKVRYSENEIYSPHPFAIASSAYWYLVAALSFLCLSFWLYPLLAPGSWSLVPGFWVPGSGFLVPGSWSLVPGSWFWIPGSWFLVPGSGSLVPGSGFLKPGGVIALLDEACMFPRSTHEIFAEKLYQTFRDNKRFSKQSCLAQISPSLTMPVIPDEMTACKRLLDKANLKDYQIGKTKVFLRAGQMVELGACRAEVLGKSASEQINSLEKKTVQEFPANVTENDLINKLASENENLKDSPVKATDNELISKLKTENEQLKGKVNSLEIKIDETERKNEESNRISEDRMSQIIETESKMIEIKTNILEEKVSDMETENQVLRQQTLLSSSSRRMSGKFSPAAVPPAENGHQVIRGLDFESPFAFLVIYAFSSYQERKVFHLPFYEGFEKKFIFYRDNRLLCLQKTFGSEDSKVRRSLMERHQAAGQPNYVAGSFVWVEDHELAWIDGEIKDSKKD
ncbi:hypothetical protein VNO80_23815 [Phaseolus coccineus]|uniref:Myosin motor domain-containing protein n=1 Tax=Phaseolus coccineus TaxID=3886 RepID=A0AAN9M9W6_PHACN